jgi:hypothetical protein
MTVWLCPGCGMRVEACAIEVGHKCPKRKNAWTVFEAAKVKAKEG